MAVVGDPSAAQTQALVRTVYESYLPNKVVVAASDAQSGSVIPLLAGKTRKNGRSTAYVCEGYRCKLPVTSPEELRKQLGGK